MPESWADYVYGMSHLTRAHALEKLRLQECFAVAQCTDLAKVTDWVNAHRAQAGF